MSQNERLSAEKKIQTKIILLDSSGVRQVFSIQNCGKQEDPLKVLRFLLCWISK